MSTREAERAEFLALTRPRLKKPSQSLSSPATSINAPPPVASSTSRRDLPQLPGYLLAKQALERYESARESEANAPNACGRTRKPVERFYAEPNTKPEIEQDDDLYIIERDLDLPGTDDVCSNTTVYDNYSFDSNNDFVSGLPVMRMKDEILRHISENSVTIVKGETGSGKSTQVPFFILEQHATEHRHCNIVCTLPRRIAVTSVAKFVCDSHGWRMGTLVGYQIAMDKNLSEDTRLTYVTTGVLLQKLIAMKNMNQYTHVIIDEVGARSVSGWACYVRVSRSQSYIVNFKDMLSSKKVSLHLKRLFFFLVVVEGYSDLICPFQTGKKKKPPNLQHLSLYSALNYIVNQGMKI